MADLPVHVCASILEITPPIEEAIREEQTVKVVADIETFLDQHLDNLPHHAGTSEKYKHKDLKRKYWRALILTWNYRYGHGKINTGKKLVSITNQSAQKTLFKVLASVGNTIKGIQQRLENRGDQHRLQMQRTLQGRSLLSITTCRDREFNAGLRALYTLGIHPSLGVEGYRVDKKSVESFPFLLPRNLQDKLPMLESKDDQEDVEVKAPKLNGFLERIYNAILDERNALPEFQAFVEKNKLKENGFLELLGHVPKRFDEKQHGFVVKVPYVSPGDCILWNEYHATAGSLESDVKITSFVDFVEADRLSKEQLLYWRYHCRHAPLDVGSGSMRGAWGDFVHMVLQENESFGMPQVYMEKFQRTCDQKLSGDNRRHQVLSREQRNLLRNVGYIVIKTPRDIQELSPPDTIIQDLNRFIRNQTLEPDIPFDLKTPKDIECATYQKSSLKLRGYKNFYYAPLIVSGDELNPVALVPGAAGKSGTAQGSALITQNSGLGYGTSYFAQPEHCAFECSDFVFNILNTFYNANTANKRSLLVVPERFRVKSRAEWKNGTHIDTIVLNHIPTRFFEAQSMDCLGDPLSKEALSKTIVAPKDKSAEHVRVEINSRSDSEATEIDKDRRTIHIVSDSGSPIGNRPRESRSSNTNFSPAAIARNNTTMQSCNHLSRNFKSVPQETRRSIDAISRQSNSSLSTQRELYQSRQSSQSTQRESNQHGRDSQSTERQSSHSSRRQVSLGTPISVSNKDRGREEETNNHQQSPDLYGRLHTNADRLETIEPCVRNSKLKERLKLRAGRSAKLKQHHPSDFWKLSSQFGTNSLVVAETDRMGLGLFYRPSGGRSIEANTVVFSETGVIGRIEDLEFAAILLSTNIKLFYNDKVLETTSRLKSPFTGVSDQEFQKATAMARSNYFVIKGNKRVLFNIASRINHSCEPNLIRSHSSGSHGDHRITLTSTKPIKPGEELFIQYSPLAGHEDCDFFACDCPRTSEQRAALDEDERIDKVDKEYRPSSNKIRSKNGKPRTQTWQRGGCMDVEQNEEVPVEEWMSDRPDGIIITEDTGRAYCIDRKNLAISGPDYLRCTKNYDPYNDDVVHVAKIPVYTKIRLREPPPLVRKSDVAAVLKRKSKAFVLKKQERDARTRRSNEPVFRVSQKSGDKMSGAYCQEGTEETLYKLDVDRS